MLQNPVSPAQEVQASTGEQGRGMIPGEKRFDKPSKPQRKPMSSMGAAGRGAPQPPGAAPVPTGGPPGMRGGPPPPGPPPSKAVDVSDGSLNAMFNAMRSDFFDQGTHLSKLV